MATLPDSTYALMQAISHPLAVASREEPAAAVLGGHARGNEFFNVGGAPGQFVNVGANIWIPGRNADNVNGCYASLYQGIATAYMKADGRDLAVTGTLMDGSATNAEIVAGGQTVIATLSGALDDTAWHPEAASDEDRAKAFIRAAIYGVDALGLVGETVWNQVVLPAVLAAWETALIRTSDLVMTLTLPAVAAYGDALGGADEIVATPHFPPWLFTRPICIGDYAAQSEDTTIDNSNP